MGFFKFMADPVHSLTGWGPIINPITEPIIGSDFQRTVTPIAGGVLSSMFGMGPGPGVALGSMAGEGAAKAAGRGAPGGDVNILKRSAITGGLSGLASYALGGPGLGWPTAGTDSSLSGSLGGAVGGTEAGLGEVPTGMYEAPSNISLGGTAPLYKSYRYEPSLIGEGTMAGETGQPTLNYADQFNNVEFTGGPMETGTPTYSLIGGIPTGEVGKSTEPKSQITPAGTSGGGSQLGGINKNMLGLMMLGGGLDYLGNKMNYGAQKTGLEDYRNAVTWTPERTAQYMTNMNNLIQGVYSQEEEKKKKSVAGAMASAGRGGGGYGSAVERLGRERRETAARLSGQALTTTAMPPNLPLGSFPYTSPEGQTLTNLGGLSGNIAQTMLMMQMLNNLYGNRTA